MSLAGATLAAALAASWAGLADPAQEARAHAVFRSIRCVQCQNQSIDDSEAPLAGELRQIIREQITAGRSDAQIRRFLTDRYGEFVLLQPRLSAANAVLWGAPFTIVAAGLAGLAWRRRSPGATPPLSAEEAARLDALTLAGAPRLHRDAPAATLPPDTGLTKGFERV